MKNGFKIMSDLSTLFIMIATSVTLLKAYVKTTTKEIRLARISNKKSKN